MEIVAYAIKLLIAGLFLHAGFSKLQTQNQRFYREVITAYGMTPERIAPALPRLLGLFEVLITFTILFTSHAYLGLFAAACLLALYLLAFTKQLMQGQEDINCGCVGPATDVKISPMLLLRNAILISLCLFSASTGSTYFGGVFSDTLLLAVPLAATMGLIYLSCEQLIINQQKIVKLQSI